MNNRIAGGVAYITRLNDMDAEIGARRNILRNGAFQVWQRATSFATGAARIYTADTWAAYRVGLVAAMTLSQQTGGNQKWCARAQRDAANSALNVISLVQHVEDIHIIPYRGQYVTLRFRARAGANYSAAGAVLSATIATGTAANEALDTTFTGLIATTTNVPITNAFAYYETLPLLLPVNTSELAINFSFTPTGTAGAADYFEVEEVQLVPTQYAGAFPLQDYELELLRCQRTAQLVHASGSGVSAAAVDVNIVLPVPMRITPTIVAPAALSVWEPSGSATTTQSAPSAVWQAGSNVRGGIARYANFSGLTASRPYHQLATTPVLLSSDI